MDFFKVRRFKKARKPKSQEDLEEKPIPHPEEPNNETNNVSGKSVAMDAPTDMDDDDDDFITNEVKRRLKELRTNMISLFDFDFSSLLASLLLDGKLLFSSR